MTCIDGQLAPAASAEPTTANPPVATKVDIASVITADAANPRLRVIVTLRRISTPKSGGFEVVLGVAEPRVT
jgi:hypothetical protein